MGGDFLWVDYGSVRIAGRLNIVVVAKSERERGGGKCERGGCKLERSVSCKIALLSFLCNALAC